jgi:WD40 repeat protein
MAKFFRALVMMLSFFGIASAQQISFDILKGNAQEILTSCFDRDSSMLFTYDRAGSIVVWDVNNMVPIKRFTALPTDLWRADATYEMRTTTIAANKNRVWITGQAAGMYAVKKGSFSVYDRATGNNIIQSDTTSGTAFTHLLNNGQTLTIYCALNASYQNGKPFYGTIELKKENVTLKKFSLPGTVSAIKVSEDEKMIALGFKRGGVDVLDISSFDRLLSSKSGQTNDEVLHIAFLKDNKGIIYSYEFLGSESIYLQKMGETQPNSIVMDKDQRGLNVSVSPSGKYVAIFNPYKTGIYDLEQGTFVAKNLTDSLTIKPNTITFLSDDIIVMAGVTFADIDDVYSVGFYEKAGLLKMNWKNRKTSANLSYDDLNRTFINAQISLVNDTTFKINGRTGRSYQHIVGPNRLQNTFVVSGNINDVGQHIENDAPTAITWYLNWDIGDYYKLYTSTEESKFDTIFVAKVKKVPDYQPLKIHSGAGFVLWKPDVAGNDKMMLITNYEGKVLYKFQSHSLFERSLKFSPNGQYLAYQPNVTENIIVNTKDFSKPKLVKTGLQPTQYMPDQLRFNQTSTKVAFRVFNQTNGFVYLAIDAQTGAIDTLCKLGISPYSYALSADFKRIALSLPLQFTDTSLFNNKLKMQEAARYGFKNIYRPNILVLDIKGDSTIALIIAKNKLMAAQLLVTSSSVIALQEDGLFYHYPFATPEKVAVQWLTGNEQVLLGSQYYYSSTGAVNKLSLKINGIQYPVGEQDRFFNQPHRIMEDFGSKKRDLVNLYQEAFNKRLKQYEIKQPTKTIDNLSQIRIPASVQQDFYTKDSVLNFTINLLKGDSEVKKIFVKINDYSVYGKNGLTIKPGQQDLPVKVPLDVYKNEILIQGVDANGRYLKPQRLNYIANYKANSSKGNLFVLTAGVSKYADTTYNLKYAAKDAVDFAKIFAYKNNFNKVIVKTLTNQEVSVKNFIDELAKAKTFNKNDVVIVFFSRTWDVR